jgi:hypothetical protein
MKEATNGNYKPKMNYSDCKCSHDWILHSNTKTSNLILLLGYLGLAAGIITPMTFLNMYEVNNVIIVLGIGIPSIVIGVWKITDYVYENRARPCDLCSCTKFESNPRPYSMGRKE